jgi:Domain of unknown function (DUF4372)
MNPGPTVFSQIMAGLNQMELARAAARFPMPRTSRSLSPYDHFAAMVFAQLAGNLYVGSLRQPEVPRSFEVFDAHEKITFESPH